uniref:C2 domain-containing protein n=1 Tax=Leptocylindrus danicus TaxID=163516 RepID=A0A7S2L7B2_9STRA|mmetsp:Transcript_32784/g.47456  ORF Transcript_32784/g.47456 Transcript_32784/m.47456 type:complete len:318 (+) Transcript_32784:136-1089(+)
MKVSISLSARFKPTRKKIFFNKKYHPFAVVICRRDTRASGGYGLRNDGEIFLQGYTETIETTLHPCWVKQFQVKLMGPGTETKLDVHIFNKARKYDVKNSDEVPAALSEEYGYGYELIDSIEGIGIEEMLERGQSSYRMNEDNLLDLITERQNLDRERGYMKLQIRGLGLKNVERGLLQGLSDPFFEIWKSHKIVANQSAATTGVPGDAQTLIWSLCYRSNHIPNHVNPTWEPFEIDTAILCNGDMYRDIKIVVYDWEQSGNHRVIGNIRTRARELESRVCVHGNGDVSRALPMLSKGKSQGSLIILKADFIPRKAF